jgi:prepilin-type N-terminal cleavage/methylation domain-containing protein
LTIDNCKFQIFRGTRTRCAARLPLRNLQLSFCNCQSAIFPSPRHGFTLVELLVVVAIIVILVTLAAVAFDKAMVSARYAKCATNLAAIAKGAASYAMGNKGRYPERRAVETDRAAGGGWNMLNLISRDAGNPGHANDDRPRLRQYFPMEALVDPLGGDIDMDDTQTADGVVSVGYTGIGATKSGTEVLLANYALIFGVTFTGEGGARMFRTNEILNIDGRRTNVLAGDLNHIAPQPHYGWWVWSSHPDHDGRLTFWRWYNQGNLMRSEWARQNVDNVFPDPPRGACDYNYAYRDGSVLLEKGSEWDADRPEKGGRMMQVPMRTDLNETHGFYALIPHDG